jgi:pSer/pThr/pTyr-binding forkhead associated (FHA) protein
MDLLDVAILALRLALVLVLYVFLLSVVRLSARALRPSPVEQAPRRTRPLRLIVVEPGTSNLQAGSTLVVADATTLGRAERVGLLIADPAISSEHARIWRNGSHWMVADLGSTNGTLLNDASLDGERPLATGDVLGLGTVRLQVVGP